MRSLIIASALLVSATAQAQFFPPYVPPQGAQERFQQHQQRQQRFVDESRQRAWQGDQQYQQRQQMRDYCVQTQRRQGYTSYEASRLCPY